MTFLQQSLPLQTLLNKYQSVRQQTINLCRPLEPEDHVAQPIVDVSPPKWHLGHTTWFFENMVLARHLPDYQLFDERLNFFFNSYYESQGPRIQRSHRGNITRPNLERVHRYRQYVDEHMSRLLAGEALAHDVQELIVLGLQHEQQHQELLLTDLKYILGSNPLFPVYQEYVASNAGAQARPARFIPFPEGIYDMGYRGQGFCYDNELAPHKTYLQAFELMDRLVTNGEYLEFIEAGGYDHFQYWLEEGWAWVNTLDEKAPLYWYRQDGQWFHFTLGGLRPVDPGQPVTHISYYEADAFARWRGLRLPTEQEWEAACRILQPQVPGDGNFVERGIFHPAACSRAKDFQLLGHAWEWTASAYLPYPGYPKLEGALGEYNGKFMINQMVLRGGSCATPQSHIRLTYRNFFHPDKRWQFTGIRLAR